MNCAVAATTRMYTPLIDLAPADPSTIIENITAVSEAIKLTEETGQKYTIITFDQQLYKILQNSRHNERMSTFVWML